MGSSWTALFTSCFSISSRMAKEQGSVRRVTSSAVLTPEDLSISLAGCNLYAFTFAELQMATRGFSENNFLGKGGFGPVYRGSIDERVRPGMASQAVAIKLLDLDGVQGHREWLAEVIFLGKLSHSNLVRLIGYCYEDQHRLLVYEYMAKGSLENHLFKGFLTFLPWPTRLKIAVGAAKGLAFLHEAEKPVIYRDFKTSNILLDLDFSAKLSDFGLAKDGPEGDNSHVTTRVMGTHGYTAPEYIMTGHLTTKSDVYSYGVVLLELLTGRKSVDKLRPSREQSLVEWARPYLNNDARKLSRIMDPCLEGMYSTEAVQRVATMAYQCLSQRPKSRPPMSAIVDMLEPLLSLNDEMMSSFVFTVVPNSSRGDKDESGCDENGDRCEGQKRSMLSAKSAIHSSNVLIYGNTLRFSNGAV